MTSLEELLRSTENVRAEEKEDEEEEGEEEEEKPANFNNNSRKRSALSFLLSDDPIEKFTRLFDLEEEEGLNSVMAKKERSSSPNEDEDMQLFDTNDAQNYIPAARPQSDYKKRVQPQGIYRLIVKCVLQRADVLISRNASRTPQANHQRWRAWEEIKRIIVNKTGQNISIEQIQTIWRHQKAKFSKGALDNAKHFRNEIRSLINFDFDDLHGDTATSASLPLASHSPSPGGHLSLAELLSRQPTLNLSLPQEENPLTTRTPQRGGSTSETANDSTTSFPAVLKTEPQSPPPETGVGRKTTNGLSDRKSPNRTKIEDDTHLALQKLIKVQTSYLEKSMELQSMQMQLMKDFNEQIQQILSGNK